MALIINKLYWRRAYGSSINKFHLHRYTIQNVLNFPTFYFFAVTYFE